ncbi:hypothetical protein tb265_43300 [Gemmatimonadetes bacterium T265]|nr:hypothetical protein tb265_43300 [Gemmatimonadetes bacterium T265]
MTPRDPDPDQTPAPAPAGGRPNEATSPARGGPVRGVARASVDVAAPPERVFEALTDPAELAAWWGGGEGRARDWRADVRPGGRWRARTTDAAGREGTVGGEYRVVDPPRTIETTWEADGDAGPSTVRYDLAPVEVGGAPGTRVTVTHTGPQLRASARAALRPAWAARPAAPAWAAPARAARPGRRATA